MNSASCLHEAAEREVEELTTQITALEVKREELTNNFRRVNHTIRSLQSRVAQIKNDAVPISRLPSDVLEIIFDESRRVLFRWTGFRRPLPIEVQLSHVCRRWRQVALNTPSLWNTLRIPILHRESAIRTYLHRCNQCPLSVHLGPQLSDRRMMDVITSELMPRIGQFRELILDTEDRQELHVLLSHLVNTAAPSLQRLKITSNDPVRGQGSYPPIEIFKRGAPLLSDVRLSALPITLPQAAVSTLHFDPLPGPGIPLPRSHLLSIITPVASSLTVLYLKGFVSGFHEEPGSAPVVLPALRELVVHDHAMIHGFNVFRNISAPSLRFFTLYALKRQALSSIHKFMTRTSPDQFHGLCSLHYIDCDMDDDLDIYLPHATSTLTHLSVSLGSHTHLMRLLSNSDKQAALHRTAPLWPRLRTLTFHVASPWSQDRDDVESDEEDELPPDIVLLLDVIQLRKAVGAELELLRLEGPHARAFHDDLALALMKSQLQVNMEVLPGLSPGNDSQLLSSGDWAYSGLFYGSEYRAHLYRKMQSGPHGQHHFHWGSVPRGPGSPLSP
ncbi:hypothetical protein F5J12DRAFT_826658 [Pisolithus orientalis]|uniref:uncharacterized protein n=1 Tax=Pisolithus orientalis TaxID=936130 RepID=UPI0022247819|nr:uncharacterized protein F5J12DRAFT_826658 [Pisolithus orientalis]KAI6008106.1 hypothetical protein F5J12DRAFT_826658 [Pisolithus orientalis]